MHYQYNSLILEDAKGKRPIEAIATSKKGTDVSIDIADNEWLIGFYGTILDFPEVGSNRSFGTNKIN